MGVFIFVLKKYFLFLIIYNLSFIIFIFYILFYIYFNFYIIVLIFKFIMYFKYIQIIVNLYPNASETVYTDCSKL